MDDAFANGSGPALGEIEFVPAYSEQLGSSMGALPWGIPDNPSQPQFEAPFKRGRLGRRQRRRGCRDQIAGGLSTWCCRSFGRAK